MNHSIVTFIATLGLYGIGLSVLAVACCLGIVALFWIWEGLIWLKNEIVWGRQEPALLPCRCEVQPRSSGPRSS
jgi:hypothetical protein